LFEVVAHRGCSDTAPENTIPAFLRAVAFGADAVELDVRLTSDRVPVVYHWFYLEELTTLSGPVFHYTWDDLRQARFHPRAGLESSDLSISSLEEVLDCLAGKVGLEVEIKGPEPESAEVVASTLKNFPGVLGNLEVTSYEPLLLERIRRLLPGIPVDLLIPRSEPWMRRDVVAYTALQRGWLAGARAVHLHPTQLNEETIRYLRRGGCEVHAWDVNDMNAFALVRALEIPRLDTDCLKQALEFREGKQNGNEP
jgi:glycerophosphoryl diester phosphodiesterase